MDAGDCGGGGGAGAGKAVGEINPLRPKCVAWSGFGFLDVAWPGPDALVLSAVAGWVCHRIQRPSHPA
jgi:hypothetical protein